MVAKERGVFLRGIDKVIKKDLEKHKASLIRSNAELVAYKEARVHEIKKRKHYSSLIGGGKYDDNSLRKSMDQISLNIRHMSDKVDLTHRAIEHHTMIVDDLHKQLEKYNETLASLG